MGRQVQRSYGKHGKALTSFEEKLLDLRIQAARQLVREAREETAASPKPSPCDSKEPDFLPLQTMRLHHTKPCNIPKLTIWEWVEARSRQIIVSTLSLGVLCLQLLLVWSDGLDACSTWILITMKYSALTYLGWRLLYWIISGEMHRYLNEE